LVSGDVDEAVRSAAFSFLAGETALHPDGVLPRELLARGFDFRGRPVPLVGPQGIFKPAVLPELPLTITTVPEKVGHARPYEDELSDDGLLIYHYRGSDPNHRDNVGLRLAWHRHTPLIYLAGVLPGQYMPFWPVYIVDDDPKGLCFMVGVSADAAASANTPHAGAGMIAEPRRHYGTTLVLRRLHQQTFRRHVIRAYSDRCAICSLHHTELLDAAHILPDTHPAGKPVVPNGLSLCTLHHAAFDRNIIGVRPDLIVHVREDVRNEADGPVLRHGLQGFHGAKLYVPRAEPLRPNRQFLEERYERFRRSA
jgi:putative restriction endonuclease